MKRAFAMLIPLSAALVHCVGSDPAIQVGPTTDDAGTDTHAPDSATDPPPGDSGVDATLDADAGAPPTGAFVTSVVLPDATVGAAALAFGANGDALIGGELSDISGSVSINGFSYTSAGGPDLLVMKLAENNGFKWVQRFGGASSDLVSAATMDASGDAYVAGTVYCPTASSTIAFGSQTLACRHVGYTSFVLKLKAADGVPQWVRSFDTAASGSSGCSALAVQPAGHVTVGCGMRGDITFIDTSNAAQTVTHGGVNDDIFLAELDPVTGLVAKSAYLAGAAAESVAKLAYDSAGDLYVAGALASATLTANIPATGAGSFSLARVGTSASATDGFIVKLAAADWAHAWHHVYGAGTQTTSLSGMALDSANNVYVAGAFSGTLDFGLGALTAAGTLDAALLELSPTGTLLAQTQIGGSGVHTAAPRVAVDSSSRVVVAGSYLAMGAGIKIGATQLPLSTGGALASFTAKFSSDLATPLWAQANASSATQNSSGLRIDEVAIDPTNQQIGTTGSLVNATADLGDATPVTRQSALFFLRRAP